MNEMGGSLWAYERFKREYYNQKSSKVTNLSRPIVNQVGGARKVTKARLGKLEFQVNPTTLTLGGGKTWAEVPSPGMEVPLIQLGCGISNTFSFELYVNEWMFDHKVDAQAFVEEMYRNRGSKKPIKFIWGKMVHDVVVTDCSIVAQSMKPDLTFREVTMSVSLTTVYM